MRLGRTFLILLLAIFAAPAATAAPTESGQVIRAADLMAQPFIDAAKVAPVTANQAVTIVERRGGWVQVQAAGKTGWLRALNVRLAPGTSDIARASNRGASVLRTGSSGRTITTGVKGLDEESIRNAPIDRAQLAALGALAVPDTSAREAASRKKLVESKVDYLKPGKVKDK